jgi:hypothetical protein
MIAILIGIGACSHRGGLSTSSPDSGSKPCDELWTVRLDVEGSYAINPGYAGPTPHIFSTVEGPPNHFLQGPTTVVVLPAWPAVSALPTELCSATVADRVVELNWLGDDGEPLTTKVDAAEIGRRYGRDARCMRVSERIGTRSLEPVRAAWRDAVAGCGGDAGARRVPVFLDFRPPTVKGDAFGRIYYDSHGKPGALAVRLTVPSLGFRRELGMLWNYPVCGPPARLENMNGIEFGCSDDSISTAIAYQIGRFVFYRTDALSEKTDGGQVREVEPPMQRLELPCGAVADFHVRSSIPLPNLK